MSATNSALLGAHKDNKGMSQARLLSQFFTKEEYARQCVDALFEYLRAKGKDPLTLTYVEPSAGDGAFVDALLAASVPRAYIRAVEVDPQLLEKHQDYIAADLASGGFTSMTAKDLKIDNVPRENIVVVGNPPYSQPRWIGRSGIITTDFYNRAMAMADTVAFIVGTTFRRPRTQTKLNSLFHLVHDENLPRTAFTIDGRASNVATVFQIWERRPHDPPREPDPSLKWLKKGAWGGPWHYVKSTDPRANIRVCHWGSHVTVGRTSDPDETARIVVANQAKFDAHKNSGKSMKNYDPDQSHFYICAEDPWALYRNFTERKHLFRQVADDRAMGQNPDLTRVDFVRVFKCDVTDSYSRGKWHTKNF